MIRHGIAVAISFLWCCPFMASAQDNKPAPPLAGALKKLDGFAVPERRLGFVSPLAINDTVPYMFYGAFRERVMMVTQTLSLAGYDIESARKAIERTRPGAFRHYQTRRRNDRGRRQRVVVRLRSPNAVAAPCSRERKARGAGNDGHGGDRRDHAARRRAQGRGRAPAQRFGQQGTGGLPHRGRLFRSRALSARHRRRARSRRARPRFLRNSA